MRWKDVNNEFCKGINRIDRLGYENVHLLGILTNRYSGIGEMKMEFVIGDAQYQEIVYKRGIKKGGLINCRAMELIRK